MGSDTESIMHLLRVSDVSSIESLKAEINQSSFVTESDSQHDKIPKIDDVVKNLKSEFHQGSSVSESQVGCSKGSTSYNEKTSAKKSGSCSSHSSSSSLSDSSYDENFFHIDEKDVNSLKKRSPSLPKIDEDAGLFSGDGDNTVHWNTSPVSRSTDIESPSSMISISPSAMQSPSTQLMERPSRTSSFRIPSAVFARSKSEAPGDWSVASNESLFSIHIGNNSFSRDNAFMMAKSSKSGELIFSGELAKSGESSFSKHSVSKSDDLTFPCSGYSGELGKTGEVIFPVYSREIELAKYEELLLAGNTGGELSFNRKSVDGRRSCDTRRSDARKSDARRSDARRSDARKSDARRSCDARRSVDVRRSCDARRSCDTRKSRNARISCDFDAGIGVDEAAAETMEEVLKATVEHLNKEKTTPPEGIYRSAPLSHRSDASAATTSSFEFSELKSSCCPSCCCFNCKHGCCHCLRQICCCCCLLCSRFRCPVCLSCNCRGTCCNCSLTCCDCAWPSCHCSNSCWKFKLCSWPCCHCPNCSMPCSPCPCSSCSCCSCLKWPFWKCSKRSRSCCC